MKENAYHACTNVAGEGYPCAAIVCELHGSCSTRFRLHGCLGDGDAIFSGGAGRKSLAVLTET